MACLDYTTNHIGNIPKTDFQEKRKTIPNHQFGFRQKLLRVHRTMKFILYKKNTHPGIINHLNLFG